MLSRGKAAARKLMHARILLKADASSGGPAWSDDVIADRLEIHYTPKYGSWLDMAEIELGILGRQCLDRRVDNVDQLTREVAVREADRNVAEAKVNWRFTTDDARIGLKKLYPSFET